MIFYRLESLSHAYIFGSNGEDSDRRNDPKKNWVPSALWNEKKKVVFGYKKQASDREVYNSEWSHYEGIQLLCDVN